MALDGFLTSASSTFDAAIACLLEAMEFAVPEQDKTPEWRYSWQRCVEIADAGSITLSSQVAVSAALEGERSAIPTGWLAVLRRLRNRSTHRTTLSRLFSRSLGSSQGQDPPRLKLPDDQAVDPVSWAALALDDVRRLADAMAQDVDNIMRAQGR